MNLILFDDSKRVNFFPFTHTRPVADIRCGILTMRERWQHFLAMNSSSTLTTKSLREVFPLNAGTDNLFVNGAIACTESLAARVFELEQEQSLTTKDGQLIALRTKTLSDSWEELQRNAQQSQAITYQEGFKQLQHVWDIFSLNADLIDADFKLLTKGKKSAEIPEYVTTIHPENIFIDKDAQIAPCIINASEGPVYIGKEAEIMEGCLIRGPFSLGTHATLKMGAKVYGGTTIGPHCKVGGEVNNVVFFNYSNKGHDGFIGNAVIGDWCNLGADTNCSNLKNNYDTVKIWDENRSEMVTTGLQFCGLLMGDHSKCGINTMFNTGTVVGISCNIFGAGFPQKHIPSFTWGGVETNTRYRLEKAIETAERMMARRGCNLSEAERNLWHTIYQQQDIK